MQLVGELARRKVLKVGAAYLATAWVLLQLTDIVAPALSLPAWTLRLVMLLLAIGFPVALLLAWQFNLTADGLAAEIEQAPPRTRKRDWLLLGLIGVLGVGVGVAGQRLLASRPDTAAKQAATPASVAPSIAVLPFVSMSANPEDGYFADGLSEEILNSLANVQGLKVAGRTSSFSYKGRDQDIRKIGRELGVAHVIEGSVRRQGDKLRVTAQLIKADDGFHLWSQTFDRELDDALAIQSEIADAVADKLRLSVMPRGTVPALDSRAQQDYLRALGLIGESSQDSLWHAVELLRPLQRAHPEFIPAYLPLADSVQRLGWYGRIPWVQAVDEMQALSEEAARRAPEALDVRVLAALIPFARNDLAPSWNGYEGILATHRKLADEAPNHALLQLNTADAARILGHNELALRYTERYVALEPRDPKGHVTVGLVLREMGRDEEAISAFRRAIAVSPKFDAGHWELARHYTRVGRFAEALDAAHACQRAGGAGTCPQLLADMYRVLRRPDLAREAEQRSGHPMQARYDAMLEARKRGGYAAVRAWLARQGAEGESLERYFGDDIATAALESGEFEALLALRLRLSPGVLALDEPLLEFQMDAANEAGVALLGTGRQAEARRMFERVLAANKRVPETSRRRLSQLPGATAMAWLGDVEGAMEAVRREVAAGWVCERYLLETSAGMPDPLVAPLRGQAEFLRLMEQVRTRNAAAFAMLETSGKPLLPDAAEPPLAGR